MSLGARVRRAQLLRARGELRGAHGLPRRARAPVRRLRLRRAPEGAREDGAFQAHPGRRRYGPRGDAAARHAFAPRRPGHPRGLPSLDSARPPAVVARWDLLDQSGDGNGARGLQRLRGRRPRVGPPRVISGELRLRPYARRQWSQVRVPRLLFAAAEVFPRAGWRLPAPGRALPRATRRRLGTPRELRLGRCRRTRGRPGAARPTPPPTQSSLPPRWIAARRGNATNTGHEDMSGLPRSRLRRLQ